VADKYDEAVKYLTAHPWKIADAWEHHRRALGGCLFEYAGTPFVCGCLTQVRDGIKRAETESLTERIRADERIPTSPNAITVESLSVFAEWQRIIDTELKRTP